MTEIFSEHRCQELNFSISIFRYCPLMNLTKCCEHSKKKNPQLESIRYTSATGICMIKIKLEANYGVIEQNDEKKMQNENKNIKLMCCQKDKNLPRKCQTLFYFFFLIKGQHKFWGNKKISSFLSLHFLQPSYRRGATSFFLLLNI